MYAKNIAFSSGFLCNSLLKDKQKNSIVTSIMAKYKIKRMQISSRAFL